MVWLSIILMGLGASLLYVVTKSNYTNEILNSKLSDKDKAELIRGHVFLETLGVCLLILGIFMFLYV